MTVTIHSTDKRGNICRTTFPNRIDFAEKSFLIPRGFESDGASIPRCFWRFIAPPLDEKFVRAGISHDFIYRTHPDGWTKKEADWMFYLFLLEDGVKFWRATLAYWAVALFGGKAWESFGTK